jgi:hypothetical protein
VIPDLPLMGREGDRTLGDVSPAAAVLALLAGAAPAAPDAAPAALLRALAEAPAGGARAAAATAPLLGARYLGSALGEGAGPDADPRFRLDAFDCQTFVETAVALGSSRTIGEARRALDAIRYQGAPELAGRHHEVLSQWIPANLARGWITDVTPEIGGGREMRLGREYTAEGWGRVHRAGRAIAGLPRDREPLGRFEAWAIPPAELAAVAARIPEGAVVFVVRQDQPDRSTRVSHSGLVTVRPGGERWVRHATSTPGVDRVIEEPLLRFARREARAYPRWPVAGYAFYGVPDSTGRVAALPP